MSHYTNDPQDMTEEEHAYYEGRAEQWESDQALINSLQNRIENLKKKNKMLREEKEETKLPIGGCLLQRAKGGGYVGNAILWWAKDDRGYTTDPFKAKIWDTKEAIEYTKGREDEFLAYPCYMLRDHVSSFIDMQNISHTDRRAALDSYKKHEEKRTIK